MDPTDHRANYTVKRIVTIWEMQDGTFDASSYVLGSRENTERLSHGTAQDVHNFIAEAIPCSSTTS